MHNKFCNVNSFKNDLKYRHKKSTKFVFLLFNCLSGNTYEPDAPALRRLIVLPIFLPNSCNKYTLLKYLFANFLAHIYWHFVKSYTQLECVHLGTNISAPDNIFLPFFCLLIYFISTIRCVFIKLSFLIKRK